MTYFIGARIIFFMSWRQNYRVNFRTNKNMFNFNLMCKCGSMTVPFSAIDLDSSRIVLEAYCPDCIVINFPSLGIISKIDVTDEERIYQIDSERVAAYSFYFGGFFGARYNSIIFNPTSRCKFQTPFFEYCEKIPICLKGCKNISIFDMILKEDVCYPLQKFTIYNQEISEVLRYDCSEFKK